MGSAEAGIPPPPPGAACTHDGGFALTTSLQPVARCPELFEGPEDQAVLSVLVSCAVCQTRYRFERVLFTPDGLLLRAILRPAVEGEGIEYVEGVVRSGSKVGLS